VREVTVENYFNFVKKLLHLKKEEYFDFVRHNLDFLSVYKRTIRINFGTYRFRLRTEVLCAFSL